MTRKRYAKQGSESIRKFLLGPALFSNRFTKVSRQPICFIVALSLICVVFASMAGAKDSSRVEPIVIHPARYIAKAPGHESLEGKALFAQSNCATCHSIDSKGGCLAPPLDGIGARRKMNFILARITNDAEAIKQFEKLYPHPELLEHPRLSSAHAKQIAAYLLTLPEPKGGFVMTPHKVAVQIDKAAVAKDAAGQNTAQTIAAGKKVFNENGCIACHSLGNIGGQFAPRLDGISKRRDRDYVEERISEAQLLTQRFPDEYVERGAPMPPANLTQEQVDQVTSFLMSLPSSP